MPICASLITPKRNRANSPKGSVERHLARKRVNRLGGASGAFSTFIGLALSEARVGLAVEEVRFAADALGLGVTFFDGDTRDFAVLGVWAGVSR